MSDQPNITDAAREAWQQKQLCRLKHGHAEGSGYTQDQRWEWEGKCNGTVRLTDTVTGRVDYEDGGDFDWHFVTL